MRIACLGGGPAGLYFAISMKLRDPAHDIDLFERNRAGRHVRLGRGLLRPDGREFDGERSRSAARRHRRRVRALGRYRRPYPWRDDPLLRPRLHRHRPQAPARTSCRSARASSASISISRHEGSADLADCGGLRPGHRRRRRQQPHPRPQCATHFGVDIEVRRNKFFWLGTHKVFDAFTFAFEQDRRRLDLGARLPLRRQRLDLHRRDGAGDLARARLRPDGPGRAIALVRADLRQISRRRIR